MPDPSLSDLLPQLSKAPGTRVNKQLPAATEAPNIPVRSGSAGQTKKGGSGGGIDSPLTETAYADRTWFSAGIKSTDGLFTLPAIKSIKMTDAGNNEVILNFKAPV